MNLLYNTGIKVVQCVTITLLLILTAYIGDITAMTTSDSISILSENQEMKVCRKCGTEKPFSEFHKEKRCKDGFCSLCKQCVALISKERHLRNKDIENKKNREKYAKDIKSEFSKRKAYLEKTKEQRFYTQKRYREINKERITSEKRDRYYEKRDEILKKRKEYYIYNREHCLLLQKERYENNKEKILEYSKQWVEKNPEKRREIAKKYSRKFRITPKGRLKNCISTGIRSSLKKGMKAGRSWEKLVGYDINKLKKHLEKQFDDNMSWDNYGSYWHIDHIIPIAAFNFEKPEDEDFRICWSLKNLRPLESKENLSKGAKIEKPFQPSLVF